MISTPAYGVHSQGYSLNTLPVASAPRPGHLQRHRRLNAAQPPLIQRDVRTHVRTYCGKPTSMTALASETGVRDAASQ
jgi:hypothetical protein